MLYAVIVLVVLALILAYLWLTGRRAARALTNERNAANDELRSTKATLESTRSDHAAAISTLETSAAETERRFDEASTELDQRSASLKAEKERATDLETSLTTALSAVTEAETARDAASVRADELHDQVNALIDDRDELRATIEHAKQAPALVLPDAASNGSASSVETLWNLELARSERTWAHSVAVNPESDESPLQSSDDPVRTAVEIEASALREEVGAFITIDWQADAAAEPSRQHLLLRVAQEILAAAAREPEASTLRVAGHGDGDVTLEVVATEDDTQVINLIAPPFDNELVDVTSAHGLKVTVKAP